MKVRVTLYWSRQKRLRQQSERDSFHSDLLSSVVDLEQRMTIKQQPSNLHSQLRKPLCLSVISPLLMQRSGCKTVRQLVIGSNMTHLSLTVACS